MVAVAFQLIGMLGLGLVGGFAMPNMTTEFDAGKPATVHLTAAGKQAIYVDWIGRRRDQTDAECTGKALGGGTIAVRPVSVSLDLWVVAGIDG